ncbi:WavE lipopolysaccharide synthesis family protein [Vibrio cionasavignyae]|uniref:WavE lipopolysaccharide synthesis family protein n=1 Tax=Vibrio cionasavignyae TaxID=2910252 RepID=UPI003D0B5549
MVVDWAELYGLFIPLSINNKGITNQCLNSIRKHLPGATINLSTWVKQPTKKLDYDPLIESDDPGE